MVQWYSGTMVQWYSGTVVQWYSGTVVQWYLLSVGTEVQITTGMVSQPRKNLTKKIFTYNKP
jgi:hypothetical protein